VGLLGLAAWRVADASASAGPASAGSAIRLEGPAPDLRLTDQHGEPFDLADLAGRPVLVVFAFAHCQTVCPLLVQQALAAQRAAEPGAAVVVVTLDPWRDTPSRLPHLARQWRLGDGAWVLSGEVPQVEATLDAWGIARSRDRSSGDIVHATQVYLVDRAGRLAWAAPGDAVTLAELLHGL
jgi:protein SCO1/2